MTINSVLGPINPDDLGFTLIHEHLSVGMPGWELDPDDCNRSDEISGAVDKMAEIIFVRLECQFRRVALHLQIVGKRLNCTLHITHR